MKENRRAEMRRTAVVLTVLATIFWVAFGFFRKALSPNDRNLGGELAMLLIFLALTLAVIWALYGLSMHIAKRSTGKN